MANKQIGGMGCLFTLVGMGILLLYFTTKSLTGTSGNSSEKLGFLGMAALCLLIGLIQFYRAGKD
jgi:hypothetical protein